MALDLQRAPKSKTIRRIFCQCGYHLSKFFTEKKLRLPQRGRTTKGVRYQKIASSPMSKVESTLACVRIMNTEAKDPSRDNPARTSGTFTTTYRKNKTRRKHGVGGGRPRPVQVPRKRPSRHETDSAALPHPSPQKQHLPQN